MTSWFGDMGGYYCMLTIKNINFPLLVFLINHSVTQKKFAKIIIIFFNFQFHIIFIFIRNIHTDISKVTTIIMTKKCIYIFNRKNSLRTNTIDWWYPANFYTLLVLFQMIKIILCLQLISFLSLIRALLDNIGYF